MSIFMNYSKKEKKKSNSFLEKFVKIDVFLINFSIFSTNS